MSGGEINIHATAIVVGTTGLLFVGPSGAGKSGLAFACLSEARALGRFAALVADDRVLVSRLGDHLLARCPPTISGLIELRHGGIVEVDHLASALMQVAISPVESATAARLPVQGEHFLTAPGVMLPLVRVPLGIPAPLSFAETVFMTAASAGP